VAIDVDTPEGLWFERLAQALHERRTGRMGGRRWTRSTISTARLRPPLTVLDDYRQGDPPLRPDIHSGWKPYVRQFVRMGRLNIADLAVTATANRMQLRDFRTASAGDEMGDSKARDIMRANGASIVFRDVVETCLGLGDSYTIVTPPGGGRTHSLITAEDPRQVITAQDPATGEYIAGLKMFRSEWDDEDIAYLYLPGLVRRATRKGSSGIIDGPFRFDPKSWTWSDDGVDVPGGKMPVTRFRNRDGVGEFERHLDTLDRINDKIFDEWWIAKIQAFRQRAVKNLPDTDEDGEEADYTDMFTASPDEMWQVPGDVEFWESNPVDLTPVTGAIQKDLERLSSTLSIPLHIITPDAANGSAEGASLMREEHVYKVENRIDHVNPSFARTMSLAFLFENEPARADITKIEPVWGPVERYSLQQKADAATKAMGTLPVETIQRDIWQYAPAEIPELRKQRGRDIYWQKPAPGQVTPSFVPPPSA
jgi:hypothetical protein